MTQKELYNKRLINEANEIHIRYNTRRFFLKESAMGFGGLALCSLLQAYSTSTANNIVSGYFKTPAFFIFQLNEKNFYKFEIKE